jgi:hypothetical protein
MSLPLVGVVTAACLVLSFPLTIQEPADPLLAATALAAADAGPMPFAAILARARIPAGVVTTDSPNDRGNPSFSPPATLPLDTPLSAALNRFHDRHPAYVIARRAGVVSLELPGACARLIGERLVGPTTLAGDPTRLLVQIVALAAGVRGSPEGVSGPFVNGDMGPRAPMPSISVTVTQSEPLRDALDRVVRQAPGSVWVVWQHTRPDGATGCRDVGIHWNESMSASAADVLVVKGS